MVGQSEGFAGPVTGRANWIQLSHKLWAHTTDMHARCRTLLRAVDALALVFLRKIQTVRVINATSAILPDNKKCALWVLWGGASLRDEDPAGATV